MIYDITPPIDARLAVWPGDTSPSREVLCDIKAGASVTLSTLRATVHLGAHADAPNHYAADASGIGERALDYYIGPCQVFRVSAKGGTRVAFEALKGTIHTPRLLIATDSYPDASQFSEDFAALAPELVDRCHASGVRLIGIDTPSVDLFSSKDLPAHKRFLANDMAILEGLVLAGVPEGEYELIAPPLRLMGYDASPVRAILRTPD